MWMDINSMYWLKAKNCNARPIQKFGKLHASLSLGSDCHLYKVSLVEVVETVVFWIVAIYLHNGRDRSLSVYNLNLKMVSSRMVECRN